MYLSTKMAAMLVVAKVLLYVTLTIADTSDCVVVNTQFYRKSIIHKGYGSPVVTSLQGSGVPAPQRSDYTYPKNAPSGYKVHIHAVPWMQARRICIDEGSHLVTLNSANEADTVAEIFRKSQPMIGSRYLDLASIGFHSLFEPDQFVTVLDQTLAKAGFAQWLENGPFTGQRRYCGSLHSSGQLNNHNCSTVLGFICERSMY